MSKKFLILAIFSIFILSACKPQTGTSTSSDQQTQTASIKEGEQAPGFSLESFEGKTVNLADFKGEKAVFVDFWAGWCPFCIGEMPEIEKISNEFKDDLVVLGIHRTETENVEIGQKFATELGITYPLLKDSDGSIYDSYTAGQELMPTAAFINKQGQVIKVLFGPKTADQMKENVKKIL